MLQVLRDVGGVEVPEYLAKLQGEGPAAAAEKPAPSANGHAAEPARN
jgi:hypothetical protein